MKRPVPLQRYSTIAAVTLLGIGAAVVLRNIDPNVAGGPLPGCPFYALTGFYCPGCGSTRCLHALVHFDLANAMAMNPMLVISLLPLLILMLHGADALPSALRPLARIFARPLPWLFVLVGYAIARNLPWFPFTLLAPG